MKKLKGLYFILTYVMFILPPFIWGLVELYAEQPRLDIHVISLIVNVIVLLVLVGLCYGLIRAKKLHVPGIVELKYLVLGLTGNTVVYFYTFQNNMKIDRYITIYLILLIVLCVHYFLISRKIKEWELWILLPIFLILDGLHLVLWGCPATNNDMCTPNDIATGWLYIVYIPLVLIIFGYYGYKIYQYKRRDFYGISNIVLVFVLAVLFQFDIDVDEKIIGTISILIAFLAILNFIVSIVNKTYRHTILLHYIRTTLLLFLAIIMGEIGFFKGNADAEVLIFMVAVTYVSLLIVILKYLLHIEEDGLVLGRTFRIVEMTPSMRNQIKEQYGDKAFDHIVMEQRSLSLVALLNDEIVGFISTDVNSFPTPLDESEEAYIHIVEVDQKHRRKHFATKLIHQSEQHYRKEGLPQIRGWASSEEVEAIQLWNSLLYSVCPTIVYDEERKVSVEGFYFIKKL